jgi:hypothetical protein
MLAVQHAGGFCENHTRERWVSAYPQRASQSKGVKREQIKKNPNYHSDFNFFPSAYSIKRSGGADAGEGWNR